MDFNKYDVIVIGSGFAGSTMAERLANDLNKKVLVIDERKHIGGNMYDYMDDNGIIIHKYGPHIFHTNLLNVYQYLSKFTDWFFYEHRVLGFVKNKLVPIPFNLTSIDRIYDKDKDEIKKLLLSNFAYNQKIPILELKKIADSKINKLADFIYENVFLYYTMKQWGKKPDEIDPQVTNRVPVFLSTDDRYFQDKYQFMPKDGYTKLIHNMLKSNNIDIKLGVKAQSIMKIVGNKIYINNKEFLGKVIYTGAIDELFDYCYGNLPYRSLSFVLKTIDKKYYQPVGTVNYPTKNDKFTRITEYKHLTTLKSTAKKTVIMKEYPCAYNRVARRGNIPYYPISNKDSEELYIKYYNRSKKIKNLYLVGRLAQYKYYNMDLVINESLKLYDEIKGEI